MEIINNILNYIGNIIVMLTPFSLLAFLIGFINQFSQKESDKRIGIKLMIYSSIVFVIGIGGMFFRLKQL